MAEILVDVNWIAVVVGAVVSFLVGWLWYSPLLFGTKWAAGVGVEMGTANEMPVGAMAAQGLGLFLFSWFVGVTAVSGHLMTLILATVAFAVLGFSGGGFRKNSQHARLTDLGFLLASMVVMILAQGIF